MSDDIVTRLRSTIHTGGALVGPEAADEIERLRAEIVGLKIRVITLLKKLEEK